MPKTSLGSLVALLAGLGLVFGVARTSHALELSDTTDNCHDPSRIIEYAGAYYVFSTSANVNLLTSTNLVNWSYTTRPFSWTAGMPAWMAGIRDVVEADHTGTAIAGDVWAPDIIAKSGGGYLLYYSRNFGTENYDYAGRPDEHSVCGAATSSAVTSGWTDAGTFLDVNVATHYSRVLDPAPVYDAAGNLWLAVGSFGAPNGNGMANGGIHLLPLNAAGTALDTSTGRADTRVAGPWIEAAFVHYRDGYYYLFFNQERCCAGVRSTYFVRVGRSTSITGPYTDLEGAALLNASNSATAGGTLFMGLDFTANYTGYDTSAVPLGRTNQGNLARELGPGHVGISSLSDGIERFSYHYYDADDNGTSKLGLKTMLWGVDGWPRAGWELPDGTFAMGTRLNASSGTALWLDASSGTPVMRAYNGATSQYWNATRVAPNTYSIVSYSSGLALATTSTAGTAAGSTVTSLATASSGSSTQQWFAEQTNDMSFRLMSGGKALEMPAGVTASGTGVQTQTYGVNLASQHWFLTPVGAYRVCSLNGGLCLQVSDTNAGSAVVQQASASSANQYWWFVPTPDGYVKLVNVDSGLVLSVEGASTADGAAVVQEADDDSLGQRWSTDVLTDGSFRFVPRASGKALSVPDASTAAGTALEQGIWAHVLNQQFSLEFVADLAGGGPTDTGTSSTGGSTSTSGTAGASASTAGTSANATTIAATGSGGTSASSVSNAGTASGAVAATDPTATLGDTSSSDDGCGCRVMERPRNARALWLAALGLLGLLARQRRQR